MYQLAAHSRGSQLPQRLPLSALLSVYSNLFDFVDGQVGSSSESFDDSLTADALIDKVPDLL